MVKILICEDQTLLRQGLVALLEDEPDMAVVGEAVNGREAVDKVGSLCPDVVLMDVRMPVTDGVEATRIIAGQYPFARVIILSTYDSADYVFEGIKAGAVGYLLKDAAAEELVETIRRVHQGEQFIQPTVASNILFEYARNRLDTTPRPDFEPLSEREIAVVSRLAHGMSNRQIAEDLGLAEGTVRNHVSSILSKLHAANRVQAINLARQHKLI